MRTAAFLYVISLVGFALFTAGNTSGCPDENDNSARHHILSIVPNPFFKSDLNQEYGTKTKIAYIDGELETDPYKKGTIVAEATGKVAEFELLLTNTAQPSKSGPHDDINDVNTTALIVTVLDRDKIIFPIPIRIADVLFYGEHFVLTGPPNLTETTKIYPELRYPGHYAFIPMGDLKAGESEVFQVVLVGQPGLTLHIEAVAFRRDGQAAVSQPETETTLILNAAP